MTSAQTKRLTTAIAVGVVSSLIVQAMLNRLPKLRAIVADNSNSLATT